jgi:hypothetical protein
MTGTEILKDVTDRRYRERAWEREQEQERKRESGFNDEDVNLGAGIIFCYRASTLRGVGVG